MNSQGGGGFGAALFSIGGNVVGGFLGGPVGASIGGLAGGLIGSMLFSRKVRPLIPDVQMMNSSYGNPIPLIWGSARLPGTVTWMTGVRI